MTNDIFRNELWIRAYMDQIEGYPLGHPKRVNFQPIVPEIEDNGVLNRAATLLLACYQVFTEEDRSTLLAEGEV